MTLRMAALLAVVAAAIVWNVNGFQRSTTTTSSRQGKNHEHPNSAITFPTNNNHNVFGEQATSLSSVSSILKMSQRQQDDENDDDDFQQRRRQRPEDDKSDNHSFSSADTSILQQRLYQLHLEILEQEVRRPPNANLEPIAVVQAIMEGLWNAYDPLPDSGFRLLLHSSTPKWRREILKAVGVPMVLMDPGKKKNNDKRQQQKSQTQSSSPDKKRTKKKKTTQQQVDYELVASALGSSMGRPHNQFAILVGGSDNNSEGGDEELEYVLDFSASEGGQLLDFGDGTCWVECRLRDKATGELLVLTGWDLVQRDDDGAWMVDWIYWQDFREQFRPGIGGRQEWLVNNVVRE